MILNGLELFQDSGDQTKVLLMKNEQISELEAKLEKMEANLTAALQQVMRSDEFYHLFSFENDI